MNYYYYGFVQVAGLAKATSIPPAIAYNLAIPTLAALLGAAAFSATLALADRGERRGSLASAAVDRAARRALRHGPRQPRRAPRPPVRRVDQVGPERMVVLEPDARRRHPGRASRG